MSIRNLDKLFRPSSIAVIGASTRLNSVGGVLWRNLQRAGFGGQLMPVNPHHGVLDGHLTWPDVDSLPIAPDLAVIATPPETVPGLIRDLGARGTKAAVIITAGFGELGEHGKDLQKQTLEAAQPHLMRLVGPNCVGVMVPGSGLDASFSHIAPREGKLAFVSQSGAMITAVLDWAAPRHIGFSHVVSLGDMADVDFGDMLDYLAMDADTRAILLYIEGIKDARKFMSAARVAARLKPVIVIKVGRFAESAKAAASHTGALAGSDAVYDAAFRRAGMLRVDTMDALFDAVEAIALTAPLRGERLTILTNGGGPGVMATDALIGQGGHLAELPPETIAKLSAVLPPTWSHGNPVDIIGDADGKRYAAALSVLLDDPSNDAILVLNCPTALADPRECAKAIIDTHRPSDASTTRAAPALFTSWLGDESAAEARTLFAGAGIASYETPDSAIRGYMQRVHHWRNQQLMLEIPSTRIDDFEPDFDTAKRSIERAMREKRDWLEADELTAVLAAYGIPFAGPALVDSPDAAGEAASRLGGAVALKIRSPNVTHKSDVGGVILNLTDPDSVRKEAVAMADRVKAARPDAILSGFLVQPMIHRPGAVELIVGMTTDSVFGPIIMFGHGGTSVEQFRDAAIELAPLNESLAMAQMARTKVWRLLQSYRGQPAADIAGLAKVMVRISQLIADFGEIAELDLNPLLADAKGVVAVDARIRVHATSVAGRDRMAITPYPKHYESTHALPDGTAIHLRPIRPEDEARLIESAAHVDPNDLRLRFFRGMNGLTREMAARLTQIDYARELALVALTADGTEGLGVVRIVADPDNRRAEFAVIVRTDWKSRGLGQLMMRRMIDIARERKIGSIEGTVLQENVGMIDLCRRLGFAIKTDSRDGTAVTALLNLKDRSAESDQGTEVSLCPAS